MKSEQKTSNKSAEFKHLKIYIKGSVLRAQNAFEPRAGWFGFQMSQSLK